MVGFVQRASGGQSIDHHKIQCFYGVLNEAPPKETVAEVKDVEKEKTQIIVKDQSDQININNTNQTSMSQQETEKQDKQME